jgi:hypothetical protein
MAVGNPRYKSGYRRLVFSFVSAGKSAPICGPLGRTWLEISAAAGATNADQSTAIRAISTVLVVTASATILCVNEFLEGWYTDPYGRHEARWMSQGVPTALVRDGGAEGDDPAPDEPYTVTPIRVEPEIGPNGGANLRRADDAERSGTYDRELARQRAFDVYDTSGSGDAPPLSLGFWSRFTRRESR